MTDIVKLALRVVSKDGTSYNGFQWPLDARGNIEVGATVTAPDWDPTPHCGNGLHGWLHGKGDHDVATIEPDSIWLAVEPQGEIIDLAAKVKFASCVIRFAGGKHEAAQYVLENSIGADANQIIGLERAGSNVIVAALGTATAVNGGTAIAGDRGTATAWGRGTAITGDRGTAIAGNGGTSTAGYKGTATTGDRGMATAGDEGAATAWNCGMATAGYEGTATVGDKGMATVGDRGRATAGDRGTATAGDRGRATAGDGGTATAGHYGTAMAGSGGIIQIKHWDGKRDRILTGYVGENGIEPDVAYRVVDGKFVAVSTTKEQEHVTV